MTAKTSKIDPLTGLPVVDATAQVVAGATTDPTATVGALVPKATLAPTPAVVPTAKQSAASTIVTGGATDKSTTPAAPATPAAPVDQYPAFTLPQDLADPTINDPTSQWNGMRLGPLVEKANYASKQIALIQNILATDTSLTDAQRQTYQTQLQARITEYGGYKTTIDATLAGAKRIEQLPNWDKIPPADQQRWYDLNRELSHPENYGNDAARLKAEGEKLALTLKYGVPTSQQTAIPVPSQQAGYTQSQAVTDATKAAEDAKAAAEAGGSTAGQDAVNAAMEGVGGGTTIPGGEPYRPPTGTGSDAQTATDQIVTGATPAPETPAATPTATTPTPTATETPATTEALAVTTTPAATETQATTTTPAATTGTTTTTNAGTDLMTKLTQAAAAGKPATVTAADIPSDTLDTFLKSIMATSQNITEEQKATIHQAATEALTQVLSGLSARGMGQSSLAGAAMGQSAIGEQAAIAAKQSELQQTTTANALKAAEIAQTGKTAAGQLTVAQQEAATHAGYLSLDTIKNDQGYSMAQRQQAFQEQLGTHAMNMEDAQFQTSKSQWEQEFGMKVSDQQFRNSMMTRQQDLDELKNAQGNTIAQQLANLQTTLGTAEMNLNSDKFQQARAEFNATFGQNVSNDNFLHALQTGQLNLEAVKVDNENRMAQLKEANDTINATADRDLQAKLGFSKLDMEAMIAGKQIDLQTAALGMQKYLAEMGFQVTREEIQAGIQAQTSANDAQSNSNFWTTFGLIVTSTIKAII